MIQPSAEIAVIFVFRFSSNTGAFPRKLLHTGPTKVVSGMVQVNPPPGGGGAVAGIAGVNAQLVPDIGDIRGDLAFTLKELPAGTTPVV